MAGILRKNHRLYRLARKDATVTGSQALAAGVILRALDDLQAGGCHATGALFFLIGENSRLFTDILGIEPSFLRGVVRKIIKDHDLKITTIPSDLRG